MKIETADLYTLWNWKKEEVPPNQRVLVQVDGRDTWATFDPNWGNGRGAWFDDKGRMIPTAKVWCFHPRSEEFAAELARKGITVR
jgi:hypothetical protein